jgi:putative aldouronate transport system substrate-binding protein
MSRPPRFPPSAFNRRRFLALTGVSAIGLAGLPLLAACQPSTTAAPTAAPAPTSPAAQPAAPTGAPATRGSAAKPAATTSAIAGGVGVKLPTHVPFDRGPKPDLPGNAQGLDPAFFSFPSTLVDTVTQTPGDGSAVSAIVYLTLQAPTPPTGNAAWQEVNRQLNIDLQLDHVASADYPARLNVLLAGNQIPDFVYNVTTTNPMGVISALPQFLQTRCVDLTPYLSEDAIQTYPNLAYYSTYTWQSAVVDDKLFGLPAARPPVNSVMMFRPDLFEAAGVPLKEAPKNADEFKRMLMEVTRPDASQWGIAAGGTSHFNLAPNSAFGNIFHVPNNWRLEGDRLVKDFETEEFRAAVGFARDLWSAGVWHPDTPGYSGTFNNDFVGGRFAVAPGVWGQYVQLWDILARTNPAGRLYPMHPFAHDGGQPTYNAGPGNFGMAYVKQQASRDRVRMLLGIANFLAAPFGSQEWLLNYYGVKDIDYTLNDVGAPVLTDQGRADMSATWRYITSPAYALFSSYRSEEFARVSHAAEAALIDVMRVDPTRGVYSETAFRQGILAQDQFLGGVSDIVQGRRALSDLDSLVASWRSSGGEQMRAEFQSELQKSGVN